MKIAYITIIRKTPAALTAEVPELAFHVTFSNENLKRCIEKHSDLSIKDFLTLYSDTFFDDVIEQTEEGIYWFLKGQLDINGKIPYVRHTIKGILDDDHFVTTITIDI